jgi:hypothetical protein
MIKAFKLYTGEDGHSYILEGSVATDVVSVTQKLLFKESAPHSFYDWHTAPVTQYVLVLSGTLEFTTQPGATFILKPGEILIAMDTTGSGHKWKMIDDQPWKRAYMVFDENAVVNFVADAV